MKKIGELRPPPDHLLKKRQLLGRFRFFWWGCPDTGVLFFYFPDAECGRVDLPALYPFHGKRIHTGDFPAQAVEHKIKTAHFAAR